MDRKRGPLLISSSVYLDDSQVTSATAGIDYVVPNHELHLTYRKTPDYVQMNGAYINTLFDDTTLMATYSYDSMIGTTVVAGAAYWFDDHNYVEMFAGYNDPVNGSVFTAAGVRGAMATTNPNFSIETDLLVINGNVADSSMFVMPSAVPSTSRFGWRTTFMSDFDDFYGVVSGLTASF